MVRLDKGFQRDMQTLQINCGFCEWVGHLKNYQDHLEKLHQQYRCSCCTEVYNSLVLLEEHNDKFCPKKLVNCILQSYGCKEQILRSDLKEHYQTEEHQRSVLFCMNQLKEQYQTSSSIDTDMKMEISNMYSQTTTTSSSETNMDEYKSELELYSKMINPLADGIHELNNEVIRLNNDALQQSESITAITKALPTIKTSIEESNNVLSAMNINLMVLQQKILSLKYQLEDQQVISYDGTLIWKINQFREKMDDAKSERQTSIYSPPFRSSPNGYQMRARLYLHGDGNARRTHMSVFFVLMRGPHDCILHFPFNYKVTFCLYDQTSNKKHIIDSFRPDIKSNSFQRPRSDMNIASGIPKFVPLDMIDKPDSSYVKDDTMFIKVMVDFENMTKTILPYISLLNPGLPAHIQQKMIRQEIERKAQKV
ncbi:unnamed protein product [Adineta steineri]|uniref:MATH domain-containing protein n=1 Tax=Adineta steineri TaxID=433720 RepID=A0A819H4E6_9BILA|nr:unnamed protein product [Adineta steineri]